MYAGNDSIVRDALTTLRKAMYNPGDGQYHPTIGYEAPIVDLKATDVREFYERQYIPQNATLFISGDLGECAAHLPIVISRLFGDYDPRPGAPRWLPRREQTAPGPTTIAKTFHTLPPDNAVTVVAYRSHGASANTSVAHECVCHAMAGTPTSKLHLALVDTGLAHGVNAFSEIGANSSELYVFVDHPAEYGDGVVAAVKTAMSEGLTDDEIATFAGSWKLAKAAEPSSLASYTNNLVDDYHLMGDANAYAAQTPAATGFMPELDAVVASMTEPYVCAYTHGQNDPTAAVAHEALVARASDDDHARTAESKVYAMKRGAPMAAAYARAYSRELRAVGASSPRGPAEWGEFGKWAAIRDASYGLTRTGCVPCGVTTHGIARFTASLTQDVITDCMPTSKYIADAVAGGYSGTGFFATATCDDDDSKKALGEMLRIYTRPLSAEHQATLVDWWEDNRKRKLAEWRHSLELQLTTGTGVASEWMAGVCSDNHVGHDARVDAVADYDIETGLVEHNARWERARRLVTAGEIGDHDGRVAPLSPLFAGPIPSPIGAPMRARQSANVGTTLNQAVVSIGRPGHTTHTDHRFWGERAVVETILFRSLGSRLMQHMRELDGDVYTCSGHLGVQASDKCKGFDKVTLLVRPGSEKVATAKVRAWLGNQAMRDFTDGEVRAAKQIICAQWRETLDEDEVVPHWGAFANTRSLDQIISIPTKIIANVDRLTPLLCSKWWRRNSGPWGSEIVVV